MSEYYSGNFYLTRAQMETNARYIYQYLSARGWSDNAIAGMLGNFQTESGINPGIWQSLDEGNTTGGYGLVQWTPAVNYLEWCKNENIDPSEMDSALQRIEYELKEGLQYYPTSAYPETFKEFKVSTKSPYYLALAFLKNYERPANQDQTYRGTQALEWYNFITGTSFDDVPSPSTPTKNKNLPLWLLLTAVRSKQ